MFIRDLVFSFPFLFEEREERKKKGREEKQAKTKEHGSRVELQRTKSCAACVVVAAVVYSLMQETPDHFLYLRGLDRGGYLRCQ